MKHVHIFELGKTDLTKKQINQIFRYIKPQTGVSRRMIDSNMDELLVTFADGVVCP